jgi:hypothetical protein
VVAYCTKDDLLTGDIPFSSKYGDGTSFVQLAADEIDATIGRIYVTPVTFDLTNNPGSRVSQLMLKKINQLLASGRIVMDMAAGGEDDNLHAYGYSMWREAWTLLQDIVNGKYVLDTASGKIPTDVSNANTAVSVHNEDGYSLVEAFYSGVPSVLGYPMAGKRIRPYDTETEPVIVP